MKRRTPGSTALHRAFDEAHFGLERTLNLRASLPTVADAVRRTESWLRQRQVSGPHDVLIITGRGNQSDNGVSPVRAAILKLLHSLRRRGVLESHREHTAGSFVATLAPMRSAIDAPRRHRDRSAAAGAGATAQSLASLEPETRALLRDLAESALADVGVKNTAAFIDAEMLRQFSVIAAAVPDGPNRERRVRVAIRAVLDEHM